MEKSNEKSNGTKTQKQMMTEDKLKKMPLHHKIAAGYKVKSSIAKESLKNVK